MNFGELKEEVIDGTVRPDRERQVRRAINSVIRSISLSGNYWRDLREEVLSEDPAYIAQKGQAVKNIPLPERFRKPAYIRREVQSNQRLAAIAAGAVGGGQLAGHHGSSLEYNLIRPNQVKAEGRLVLNSYYLSGDSILLNQNIIDEVLLWGYYTYPIRFTDPKDENWISIVMPDLIIDWASTYLLATLGDRDRTAGFQALQTTQLSIFVDEAIRDHEMTVEVGR